MDGFPETLITLFAVSLNWANGHDVLTVFVMVLAGFFWLLKVKQLIQEQYFNSFWGAIKSLFKRRNKYGENDE